MGWRHARFGIVRFTKDVAVIGIGRGTASALLREAGCSVMGLTGSALLASIRAGKCPSRNRGDELAKVPSTSGRSIRRGKPTRSSRWAPLRSHIETNLDHVTGLLHPWCPTRQGPRPDPAQMALRHQRFRAPLPELHVLAHRRGIILLCPERIAEGAAGLKDLPQIIGAGDDASRKWRDLFGRVECLADAHPPNRQTIQHQPPRPLRGRQPVCLDRTCMAPASTRSFIWPITGIRGASLPPRMTAEPACAKISGERSVPYPDLTLAAWKINEFMPSFWFHLAPPHALHKSVGLSDIRSPDDERDSLCPKRSAIWNGKRPGLPHTNPIWPSAGCLRFRTNTTRRCHGGRRRCSSAPTTALS